ncbi:hypothetical protein P885DRAFT_73513 [Corynascus similis CBS 632.67]
MDGTSHVPSSTSQQLGPVRATTRPVEETPQSASSTVSGPFSGSGDYCNSPTSTSSTVSPLLWDRLDSRESAPAPMADPMPKRESFGKANANSYCGRHSKEFLFGGKGFHDLWRAVRKK